MSLTVKEIITLCSLFGVASKKIYRVAELSGGDLLRRVNSCGLTIRENAKNVEVTASHLDEAYMRAEKIMRRSEELGIGFLSYYDDAYPELLRGTVTERGELLPPLLLYTKGDLSALNPPCLTIAGTRNPSVEGAKASAYFAREFVKEGFCIVSGLALGCDASAHRGALEAKGRTVALMAHGLDIMSPPENRNLAAEIVDAGGLLLSEYPVGMSFSKYSFIARDRLQAGLSLATVVVQTDVDGGSMHVSNCTLKAGKPLFTTYFKDERIRSLSVSAGNDSLVRQGARYLRGEDDLHLVARSLLEGRSV